MAEVKRFNPENGCGMEIEPRGRWVTWEDHMREMTAQETFRDEALRVAVAARNEQAELAEAAESRCKELEQLLEDAAHTFELRSEKDWRFGAGKCAGYRESARFLRELLDRLTARTALKEAGDDD